VQQGFAGNLNVNPLSTKREQLCFLKNKLTEETP